METQCPVCGTALIRASVVGIGDRYFYDCPRCGPYSLTGSAKIIPFYQWSEKDDRRIKLSYALRRMSSKPDRALLDSDTIGTIIANAELPGIQEQLTNFIEWAGRTQPSKGGEVPIAPDTISWVGATDDLSLGFLVEYAVARGLIRGNVRRMSADHYSFSPLQLTFDGWQLYEELQRSNSTSRVAFMAMQFGNTELDAIYNDHFKPAVAATGFTLKRLDEGQPAGLIDDRLRVEIRQARFLISDLSTANKGAYWEAGYAEGLGKPVIYTCRKDAFDDKATAPHFDTNHHLTVVWEADKLGEAMEKLKATIRATLPEDAKLSD